MYSVEVVLTGAFARILAEPTQTDQNTTLTQGFAGILAEPSPTEQKHNSGRHFPREPTRKRLGTGIDQLMLGWAWGLLVAINKYVLGYNLYTYSYNPYKLYNPLTKSPKSPEGYNHTYI